MNRRSIRALTLAATLVAMLVTMVSSAGATTWRSTGGSFTATAGSSTIDMRGGTAFACATASATGTVTGTTGPVLPATWPAIHGTMKFTNCTPVGYSIHCFYTLTATIAGATGELGGTTAASAGVHCIVYIGGQICRTISGGVTANYANPATNPGDATLTLANTTGLTFSTAGMAACALATGQARFTGAAFAVTSPAPSIWAS